MADDGASRAPQEAAPNSRASSASKGRRHRRETGKSGCFARRRRAARSPTMISPSSNASALATCAGRSASLGTSRCDLRALATAKPQLPASITLPQRNASHRPRNGTGRLAAASPRRCSASGPGRESRTSGRCLRVSQSHPGFTCSHEGPWRLARSAIAGSYGYSTASP